MTSSSRPRGLWAPAAGEACWACAGRSDGDASVRREALWGLGPRGAVCFLVVSNSRALPSPGERRGGETAAEAAAAAVAVGTLLSLSGEPVLLPLPSHCLLCV